MAVASGGLRMQLAEQELAERIAYKIAVKRYGKKQADALQFSGHLGWCECLMFADIAIKEIKKCEIAKGVQR